MSDCTGKMEKAELDNAVKTILAYLLKIRRSCATVEMKTDNGSIAVLEIRIKALKVNEGK